MLVTGLAVTRIKTIDDDTMNLIERALEIETEDIWPGYKLSNYPMDVNYNKMEFRYDNGSIKKQEPTLEVLALSAIMDKGNPVLKVLPFKMVRNISDLGGMDLNSQENMYISILVHEGFHCFQMENGMSYPDLNDIEEVNAVNLKSQDFENHLYKLDQDTKYQNLWKDEIKGLLKYFESGKLTHYNKARSAMESYVRTILGEDFLEYNNYKNRMELQEGTARYVEERALEILGESNHTLEFDGNYRKGVEKYYFSGAIKSYILAEKNLFNIEFDFETTLDDLLEEIFAFN